MSQPSEQKEEENNILDDEIPDQNRSDVASSEPTIKATYKVLPKIRIKHSGTSTNAAIIQQTLGPNGKKSSKNRRLASLDNIIPEVESQFDITLFPRDIEIAPALPPKLQDMLNKKKSELIKTKCVDPSKSDFKTILLSHGDDWHKYTTKNLLPHKINLFVDTKSVDLAPQVHAGPSYQTEQQLDHVYHINILNRMPHIRSCIIEYRKEYESKQIIPEDSDIVIFFMEGNVYFVLLGQVIKCPVGSQIICRSGMNFHYKYGARGGKIKFDVINLGVAYMGDELERCKDDYFYIPHVESNSNSNANQMD